MEALAAGRLQTESVLGTRHDGGTGSLNCGVEMHFGAQADIWKMDFPAKTKLPTTQVQPDLPLATSTFVQALRCVEYHRQ